MPELPEVETVKRRLNEVLVDKVISDVKVLRSKSFQGNSKKVCGAKILFVERRAKLLRVGLENNLNLLIHLKMTGQLIFQDWHQKIGGGHPTADWTNALPSSHTRVIFTFLDCSQLFFNDMRVFGWIKVLSNQQVKKEYKKYGPDANSSDLTSDYLYNKLASRSISIKQAIMINEILAGVGNIYASEALFVAGIDPRRSSQTLSLFEVAQLVKAIKQVMAEGIENDGTTFDGKFVSVDGLAGAYQDKLRVYGKEGDDCLSCGRRILKIQLGNRGTYFCEKCQQ